MSIIGIGIDILEVKRIKVLISKFESKFPKRILTMYEFMKYKKFLRKEKFLSKHFAIKEAAVKAFGTGIRNNLSFHHLEVYNNQLGKPKLRFFNQALKIANILKVKNVKISFSDEKKYSIAVVVLA